MREDFLATRTPPQSRNFWTKAIHDEKWIEDCMSKKDKSLPETDKKPPKPLWNCYSKHQKAQIESSYTAQLEKKMSLAEMVPMEGCAQGFPFQLPFPSNQNPLDPTSRVSTPQPTCLRHCISARNTLSLVGLSQRWSQPSPSNASLDSIPVNQLPARKRNFNNFSVLEELMSHNHNNNSEDNKGNVNSNNKPSGISNCSTSELESSEEEIKAPVRKNRLNTRSNFRRMSSADVKKPQRKYKENMVSATMLSGRGLSNNADPETDGDDEALITAANMRSSQFKVSIPGANSQLTSKNVSGFPADLEKDTSNENMSNEKEPRGTTDSKKASVQFNTKPIERAVNCSEGDYLKSLVGGDTVRPVELKHYNSNEFIGQILKMRGGWRFNINFSEMEGEGDDNQVVDGIREDTVEEKVSVVKKKEQPEFCGGKFRTTFDEFIQRWKGSVPHKVFKDIEEDEPVPIDLETPFQIACNAKSRKIKFSRYKSIPKRFGECEINLFYSPRRCQL